MADRYWVGGTASWDGTAGAKWASTSGGVGGSSVPTASDNVFIDSKPAPTWQASTVYALTAIVSPVVGNGFHYECTTAGTTAATEPTWPTTVGATVANGTVVWTCRSATVTVATVAGECLDLNFTGYTRTFAGTLAINISGSLTAVAAMTWSHTGTLTFIGTGARTLNSAGKSMGGLTVNSATLTLTLQSSFFSVNGILTVTSGTFDSNNFTVSPSSLNSSNTNVRTINFGSSTVSLSGSTTVIQLATVTNLTFNAGTSTITLSSSLNANFFVTSGGVTFYNLAFTNKPAGSSIVISGVNTFNDLQFNKPSGLGLVLVQFSGNQTINGSLIATGGTDARTRLSLKSDIPNTVRTLTAASSSGMTDVDFGSIAITGAASPITGTRIGDLGNTSGVTTSAPKTVYWSSTSGGDFVSANYALMSGGAGSGNNFPLAQDTAIFDNTYPSTGATISANLGCNMGTIDMSARTTSTILAGTSGGATLYIYGGVLIGAANCQIAGSWNFEGDKTQNINTGGGRFTNPLSISKKTGSSFLLTGNLTTTSSISLNTGVLDLAGFNITQTAGGFSSNNSSQRTINIGSGVWTIGVSGASAWNVGGTGLELSGTGTISLTSASAKTFAGGGVQTYPTINQGGAGALTISGSNGFQNITNTQKATGATTVTITFGTRQVFQNFNLSGEATRVCTLNSSSTSVKYTLIKSSTWFVGANSTNTANNTGVYFAADPVSSIDYLAIRDVNAVQNSGLMPWF
jgi:hypothetical protein